MSNNQVTTSSAPEPAQLSENANCLPMLPRALRWGGLLALYRYVIALYLFLAFVSVGLVVASFYGVPLAEVWRLVGILVLAQITFVLLARLVPVWALRRQPFVLCVSEGGVSYRTPWGELFWRWEEMWPLIKIRRRGSTGEIMLKAGRRLPPPPETPIPLEGTIPRARLPYTHPEEIAYSDLRARVPDQATLHRILLLWEKKRVAPPAQISAAESKWQERRVSAWVQELFGIFSNAPLAVFTPARRWKLALPLFATPAAFFLSILAVGVMVAGLLYALLPQLVVVGVKWFREGGHAVVPPEETGDITGVIVGASLLLIFIVGALSLAVAMRLIRTGGSAHGWALFPRFAIRWGRNDAVLFSRDLVPPEAVLHTGWCGWRGIVFFPIVWKEQPSRKREERIPSFALPRGFWKELFRQWFGGVARWLERKGALLSFVEATTQIIGPIRFPCEARDYLRRWAQRVAGAEGSPPPPPTPLPPLPAPSTIENASSLRRQSPTLIP